MAVYDNEKQKDKQDDGTHDDSVDPGQREAEVADNSDNQPEPKTSDSLADQLGSLESQIGQGDPVSGGLFKNDKAAKKPGRIQSAGSAFRNRKVLIGVGGGIVGLVFAGGILFNFLHTFQLDHFMKVIEQKTSQRLSASIETRNQALVRAYIRLRVTEIQGGTNNDNLYFRSSTFDSNNPIKDWYTSMRGSRFESDLLAKEGISFTTVVDDQGKINFAKITGNDAVPPDLINKYDLNSDAIKQPDKLIATLNTMNADDMEKIFTVDSLNSSKEARKSVKQVVNSKVPWYRAFKRRHARQDIANATGIKNWRLFEKTRDKIAKNKQDIKDRLLSKIIDRYYINNPGSAAFLKCLFSSGRCPTNTDPGSPDTKTDTPSTGHTTAGDSQNNPDGKPSDPNASIDTAGAGDDIDRGLKDVVETGLKADSEKVATNAAINLTMSQKLILGIVRTVTGDTVSSAVPINPSKIWTWAKRIAKIDGLLHATDEASKLAKLVMNARRSQYEGLYATYAMASDQMKSGQLVGQELNDFFDTTKNIGNSEGWAVATNELDSKGNKVAAAASTNLDRNAYCALPIEKRPKDAFAYFCDDEKPNSGGNASKISDAYNASVGPYTAPVVSAVNAVDKSPIGGVANWVNGVLDSVISKVTDPLIKPLLDSGLGRNIQNFMGTIMLQLLSFLGAGPKFTGDEPGIGNYLTAGAAAQAEGSTRASGGIRSTAASLSYTNNLAAQYQTEQDSQKSLASRYFSLDDTHSLASTTLFAVSSNVSLHHTMSSLSTAVSSIPTIFGNIISGRAFAAQAQPANAVANWAGLDTYDIPQQCQALDPLNPQYSNLSTNAGSVLASYGINGFTADMATMRDTNKFWAAVYAKIGDRADAQTIAEKIYNCALFDARVMGGIGSPYGYNQDNAYPLDTSADTPATTPTGSTIVGDPFGESASVQCAAGTKDLGTSAVGYNDGNPIQTRLCAIPNITSTGDESSPSGKYYIAGAEGKAIVNSRVSGAYFAMASAAEASGVPLRAASSFRTMAHQQDLFAANPDPSLVARPGTSNHQAGAAIDFQTNHITGGSTCATRARAPGDKIWDWLFLNAEQYGFKQYSKEAWHWDPSPAANRCGSKS